MHMYEDIEKMLCRELEDIAKSGELDMRSLDTLDKLTHSLKSVKTIQAMEDYSEDGASYRRGGRMSRTERGASYRDDERGMSERRDSRGRFSRGSERDAMIDKMRDMMADSNDDRIRSKMQIFIDRLSKA